MADWSFWLIAAGVAVTVELFIGTFYLLMIAIGLVFGARDVSRRAVGRGARAQRVGGQSRAGAVQDPRSARQPPDRGRLRLIHWRV